MRSDVWCEAVFWIRLERMRKIRLTTGQAETESDTDNSVRAFQAEYDPARFGSVTQSR